MRCEVCGRKIREAPQRVVIEGAKLTVCIECSKHGKVTWDEPAKPAISTQRPGVGYGTLGVPTQGPIQIRKRLIVARVDTSQEIVQDYAEVIKEARIRFGLSHEDLGKKINEKESVLRKIETHKISPTDQLVSKLEHTLKIKLLVPVAEEKTPAMPKVTSHELTLGDLIKFEKKGKGE